MTTVAKPTTVSAKPAVKPVAANTPKPAVVSKPAAPAKATSERDTGTATATDAGGEDEDEDEETASRRAEVHPNVGSEDKALYPFTFPRAAVVVDGKSFPAADGNFPADFSHSKHRYLKRTDFVTPTDFAAYKFDAQRVKFERAESRYHDALLGRAPTASGGDEKRLTKMLKRIAELRKTLAGKGVDVAAIEKLVASEDAAE